MPGSCSYFVSDWGLELLFLRYYWVPIPDPDLLIVLGAYYAPTAVTKLSPQNYIPVFLPFGDSVPLPQREQNSPPPSAVSVAITLSSS